MINLFSERIRLLRNKMNYNQYEFSNLIGIKQPTLSTYERGTSYPSLEVLITISQKCNVSLDWLCGLDTKPHFYTMADIITAFLDFTNLSTKPIKSDVIKQDYASSNGHIEYYYNCTLDFSGYIDSFDSDRCNALGHLCEFIKNWDATRKQLEKLTDTEIIDNYYQMWLDKQLKHYSSIPITTFNPDDIDYPED